MKNIYKIKKKIPYDFSNVFFKSLLNFIKIAKKEKMIKSILFNLKF